MRRTSPTSWLAASLMLLVVPGLAHAEIVIAESIEWVLATSERVVVGKVVKADKVFDDDRQKCLVLTVAVSKTLKGQHSDRVTFVLPSYISTDYGKQWLDEGIPIVFCLTLNDGTRVSLSPHMFPWVARETGNGSDTILLGKSKHFWTGCEPVLTREFSVLTEPDAILKFLDKTLQAQAGSDRPRGHMLLVPGGTPVFKRLWSRSAVFLFVPVDEALEALGARWCKADSPYKRDQGAKILGYFKSDRNIALLKGLLDDPSTSESTLSRLPMGKTEFELIYRKTIYYVRQAAYDSLRAHGVQVEQPVLEILLEGRDEPEPKKN